jgi:hypothetical protein
VFGFNFNCVEDVKVMDKGKVEGKRGKVRGKKSEVRS